MPAATVQQLIDAGADVVALAAVVNGSDTAADVVTRTGPSIKTLAKAIKSVGGQLTLIGAYDSSHTYAVLNVVSLNGNSYASIANGNINNDPATSPSVWLLLAAKGNPGVDGGINMAEAAGISAAILPAIRNLFDKSLSVINFSIHPADGTLIADSGHVATGFVCVAGLTQITTSHNQNDQNSNYGYAWYDKDRAFLSGSSTSATTLTVPTGACYYRQGALSIISGIVTSDVMMIVSGSALPGSYVAFGYDTPAVVDAKIATAIATLPPSATLGHVAATVAGLTPPIVNLLDLSRATINNSINPADGTLHAISGHYASDYIYVFGQSFVTQNESSADLNSTYGYAFYDVNKVFIGGSGSNANFAVPVAVPSGAYYYRTGFRGGTFALTNMIVHGSTLPSSFIGYGYYDPATADAKTLAAIAADKLSSLGFGAFGDSISALFYPNWQTPVAAKAGMTHVFNDARGGRQTKDIFENYNFVAGSNTYSGTPAGGAGIPPGNNGNWQIGLTTGNTLAQDMAKVGVCCIFLGTNDGGYVTGGTVGAPSDSANRTGSFCAAINFVLQTLQAANPSMRIIWITPYQYNPANGHGGYSTVAGNQQLVDALIATCAQWGVPVIDLFRNSGINPQNWTLALGDGLHPSPAGFSTFVVPAIARIVASYK